jgi:hypothetical protein
VSCVVCRVSFCRASCAVCRVLCVVCRLVCVVYRVSRVLCSVSCVVCCVSRGVCHVLCILSLSCGVCRVPRVPFAGVGRYAGVRGRVWLCAGVPGSDILSTFSWKALGVISVCLMSV